MDRPTGRGDQVALSFSRVAHEADGGLELGEAEGAENASVQAGGGVAWKYPGLTDRWVVGRDAPVRESTPPLLLSEVAG